MAIESICAGCGQRLSVADENAGKRARCPACGHIYTIPPASSIGAAPPAELAPLPLDQGASPGDSFSAGTTSGSFGGFTSDRAGDQRYWMRTVDGTEYGPVDAATLQRWFHEGRVGPGYQIRQSEFANWQAAELFRPGFPSSSGAPVAAPLNPYSPAHDPGTGMFRYPKSDQSVLILVMGILGFACCPVFGIVAWVMGHTALNDIQAGLVDPGTKGLVQAGYYLGIASVLINVLCGGGMFVLQALRMVGG